MGGAERSPQLPNCCVPSRAAIVSGARAACSAAGRYLHLHANRLLGTNPSHEQLALELLRRTHEGLIRAPVN